MRPSIVPLTSIHSSDRITRLAPSPTGTLHLGNVRTFLINWALARQNNWRIIMRIEDLDRTRIRPDADRQLLDALQWLGIDWDAGPFYQSHDLEPYRDAMRRLATQRSAYACPLTRKQIAAAVANADAHADSAAISAPHEGDMEPRFPPHLRATDDATFCFARENVNYRHLTCDEAVCIHDEFAGNHTFNPHSEVGDFLIWTKLGVPGYQLAVVVDDARQGVTDVVRGNDLLPSAARQTLLYRALGLPVPRWWHLPLVVGPDGRRLAKRTGDTHLNTYRQAGVRPERIIGLLARWCGIEGACANHGEMSRSDFLHAFRIDNLSTQPHSFTREDHEWLLAPVKPSKIR